jgi:hypothetical protein
MLVTRRTRVSQPPSSPPLLHALKLAYRRALDTRRQRLEHDQLMQDPRTAVEHDLALRHSDAHCPFCN